MNSSGLWLRVPNDHFDAPFPERQYINHLVLTPQKATQALFHSQTSPYWHFEILLFHLALMRVITF